MIVGIIFSNSQVCMLGYSLWKHSLQYVGNEVYIVGNEGIYSVDKDLVKQTWQK